MIEHDGTNSGASRRASAAVCLRPAIPLLLLCIAASALAADDDAAISADEAALFGEIPSVYAASKYEQKVTDAPAAVSIVTGDQIQKLGYQTLGEILGAVPGLFTTYDRNYTYLAVRGFGIAGDYNSRVLLLVDGHRVNDAIYESAPMGSEFPVHVDLIDRVEIVPGPSSSLYGSSAFLAVINVITRQGRDIQSFEASAGGGSQETWLGRGAYGKRYDNGVEVLFSGSYYRSEGKDRLFFKEFDDPSTNDGIARDVDEDESYQFFGELSYEDWKLQVVHADRRKEVPTASFETEFNTEDNFSRDTYTWVDASYNGELGDGWQVSGRAFYDRYDYDQDYLYDNPPIVTNRDIAVAERWGLDLAVTQRFLTRHLVSIGAEVDHNFRQDQKNEDRSPAFTYLDDRRSSADWGVYVQDEIDLFEWLQANVGVRYDGDSVFGSTVNPRVALIVDPLEDTTVKLLYGTAFRAPSAYELYYNDGGDFTKSNPDLDPETIETFEFVIEQGFGPNVRASVSGYYNEIEDLIEAVEDPADGLVVFENRSRVNAYGLEVRVDGHWEDGLEAELSYALHRTEDDRTGSRLPNAPTHLASGRLIVPLIPRLLFGSVELRFLSDRKTVAGTRVDDVLLTHVTLLNRELIDGLEIQVGVDNLFDVEHADPTSFDHLQESIEQDGRLFFAKLTHRF